MLGMMPGVEASDWCTPRLIAGTGAVRTLTLRGPHRVRVDQDCCRHACRPWSRIVYSTAPACWAGSLHLDTESGTPWLQVTMVVCNWVHASSSPESHARHCLTQSLHATLLP